MLAPQSGQTRLRIAEIKLIWVLPATEDAAIISPCCGGSSPPNAQNLQRGAAGAFWGGRSLERSAAPRVRCRHEEQLSRQMLCSERTLPSHGKYRAAVWSVFSPRNSGRTN